MTTVADLLKLVGQRVGVGTYDKETDESKGYVGTVADLSEDARHLVLVDVTEKCFQDEDDDKGWEVHHERRVIPVAWLTVVDPTIRQP